jgi:hypothetical protein
LRLLLLIATFQLARLRPEPSAHAELWPDGEGRDGRALTTGRGEDYASAPRAATGGDVDLG